MIPLATLVAIAIDYSRLTRMRAELQNATDAAVLAATMDKGVTSMTGDLSPFATAAARVLEATLHGSDATLTPSRLADRSLCIDVTRVAPLQFGRFLGMDTSNVRARACAAARAGAVKIALALDNSGSMSNMMGGQTKLSALVAAVGDMTAALSGGDVVVSAVPFSSSVNVGPGFAGASWFDNAGAASTHWKHYTRVAGAAFAPQNRFRLYDAMQTPWKGCVDERPAPFTVTDDSANPGVPDTTFMPLLAPDEPGGPVGATYDYDSSYNTYLTDSGGSCVAGDADAAADAKYTPWHGAGLSKSCKYNGQKAADVTSGDLGATTPEPVGPD